MEPTRHYNQNFRKSPNIPIPTLKPPLSRTSGPLSERSENSPTPPDSQSLCELAEFVSSLTINRYKKDEKQIRQAIKALSPEFHGLADWEIKPLVEKVVCNLADPENNKGTVRESKKRTGLPRTLYFDYNKHEAYVFLKTKGNLPKNEGGYRRGTRAIRICWIPSSRKSPVQIAPVVERAFQLVSLDAKCDSETAHILPFQLKLKKVLSPREYDKIKDIFAPCHTFFQYQKIKKGTNEPIKKSCMITACYPASLADLIIHNEVSTDLAIAFAYDILRSLQPLHARGIIHGDIKAGNILVDEHGKAKLIDFDFATMPNETPRWQHGFYGTFTHSAPELLRSESIPSDTLPRVDIYALGITLFRIAFKGVPAWSNELITYKEFGCQQTLEQVLEKQEDLLFHCEQAKRTIGKNPNDEDKFLQDLALLMLHPNPALRISADEAITKIGMTYDLE